MSAPLLDIQDLRIWFEPKGQARKRVVDGVSFSVASGDRLAVIGESGSGKTLAALSVLDLLPQGGRWRGRATFKGDRLDRLRAPQRRVLRGGKIGIVFQDALAAFNPLRTVGSVLVESARRHGGLTPLQAKRKAVALLGELGVPEPDARFSSYPHQLSGGLRQRAMIALALINDPDLLIADEPTTALDATIQAQILDLLKARSQDKALIFITHDLVAAARLCDRAILMRHGRIVETGALPDMFEAPRSDYGRALVAASPAFADWDRHTEDPSPASPALTGTALSKRYKVKSGTLHALRDVSISVGADDNIAIVGESGCGKSTLAKILVGMIRPDDGTVLLNGTRVCDGGAESRAALRAFVQFVFQDPYSSLDPHWPVIRTVAEPLMATGEHDRATALDRAAQALLQVGITEDAHHRRPRAFSGGQRQRIAIARALVARPKVLVADEPLSALDMTIQKSIVDLLLDLRKRFGLGIVMVSHDLDLVAQVSDRVIVMYLGQIVEQGPAHAVIAAPRHHYTAALLAASKGAASVRGDVPSPVDLPAGCAFAGRCAGADDRCRTQTPPITQVDGGHSFACWNPKGAAS